jgi:hypothetical protein
LKIIGLRNHEEYTDSFSVLCGIGSALQRVYIAYAHSNTQVRVEDKKEPQKERWLGQRGFRRPFLVGV